MIEREALLGAVRIWVAIHPNPETTMLHVMGRYQVSPVQILKELENETQMGQIFERALKSGIRHSSLEQVLARFVS